MLKTINKEYAAPEFVLQGKTNSVFFVASGETPTVTGSIKSMTIANGSW